MVRIIALLVVASAIDAMAQPEAVADQNIVSASASVSIDYVVQPLDLIQIQVFQEPDMDRLVRISKESTVMLPLIGMVDLSNSTIRQVEERITSLYNRDYLVNPQITITVVEYARRTVNVLGMVNNPGEIEFPREEGLFLLEAIARAGGFTRLANRKIIKLTRQHRDGEVENFTINAEEIIQGNTAIQWSLETGDIIYVPERFL